MPLNHGCEYRERIPAEAEGRDIVAYLAGRYEHSTAVAWQARLAAGELRLDGAPAAAGVRLRRGQALVWQRPPWEEPQVPLAFGVLYRDAHLLAVAKPSGLPTLPNGGFLEHTLLHLLRSRGTGASPLHRLGRATSGLVLCARSRPARSVMAAAWRAGSVHKSYLALVRGRPERERFDVALPIGLVVHTRLAQVHGVCAHGKPALTHVRVLATRGANSLIEAHIPTGRPHQIRIHLAAAGHPLVGDPLYAEGGRPDPARASLPGDGGYRLHAHRLSFRHPVSNEEVKLECLPPPELRP